MSSGSQKARLEALFEAMYEVVGRNSAIAVMTSPDVRLRLQELMNGSRVNWEEVSLEDPVPVVRSSDFASSSDFGRPGSGYGKALVSRSASRSALLEKKSAVTTNGHPLPSPSYGSSLISRPPPDKRMKTDEGGMMSTSHPDSYDMDVDSDVEIEEKTSFSEGSSPPDEYGLLLQQHPIPAQNSNGSSFSPTCESLLEREWEGIENASHLLLLDIENIPDFFTGAARMEQSCRSIVIPPNCFVICCWGRLFTKTRFAGLLRGHVLKRLCDMKRIKFGCAEGGTSNASDTLLMWWVMDLCIGKDAKIPTSTPITLISGDNDFDELHRDLTTEGFSFTRFLSYDDDNLKRGRNDYGGHDRQFFTQLRSRLNAKKGRVKDPVKERESHVGKELDFSSQLSISRQLSEIKKNMKQDLNKFKNKRRGYVPQRKKDDLSKVAYNALQKGKKFADEDNGGNSLGNYGGPTNYFMPTTNPSEMSQFPEPPKNIHELALKAKQKLERRYSETSTEAPRHTPPKPVSRTDFLPSYPPTTKEVSPDGDVNVIEID